MLVDDDVARVAELTETAIARLAKRQIVRTYPKDGTICLSHTEATKVKEYLAACELDESALEKEILGCVENSLGKTKITEAEVSSIAIRARRVLERALYTRAETFAGAILNQRISDFALDHVKPIVLQDLNTFTARKGSVDANPEFIEEIVRSVLGNTSAEVYKYLKGLADAYTLMAFLNSTPDVQAAMQKIFSHGEVWLDTTILLPLLAEELFKEGSGRIQSILSLASSAGIELYTTPGVLEELSSHIKRAVTYTRIPGNLWEGGIPFIFEVYVRAGEDPGHFEKWIENFMGDLRPNEDLSAYIQERFCVKTADLQKELLESDQDLRSAIDEIWLKVHELRRSQIQQREKGRALDPLTVLRLAKHDTESYLGVIQRRQTETASPLGYRSWWLTFDTFALRIGEELRTMGFTPPSSPVLSIDFLSQYLTLGPVRGKMPKGAVQDLPLVVEPRLVAFLTPELLEQAKEIRSGMAGLPERVISRKVRDHLDSERRKMGPLSERGTSTVFDEISDLQLQN